MTLVFRRCSLAVEPVAGVGQGNTIPGLFTAPNRVSDCYWPHLIKQLTYVTFGGEGEVEGRAHDNQARALKLC